MRIGALPVLKQMQRRIRRKRIDLFLNTVKPSKDWKILDVGGTTPTWRLPGMEDYSATLLNLGAEPIPEDLRPRISSMAGDATNLSQADDTFDLVFSNSVIEHVYTWENQQKFAAEAMRVGKALWIQTPAQEFFFEPHYITPFFHWFSKPMRKKLGRFTVWGLFSKAGPEAIAERVEEIRLLTRSECEELFPGCEILEEKFLGMVKSYIIIRRH